jgi:hypothetical protein
MGIVLGTLTEVAADAAIEAAAEGIAEGVAEGIADAAADAAAEAAAEATAEAAAEGAAEAAAEAAGESAGEDAAEGAVEDSVEEGVDKAAGKGASQVVRQVIKATILGSLIITAVVKTVEILEKIDEGKEIKDILNAIKKCQEDAKTNIKAWNDKITDAVKKGKLKETVDAAGLTLTIGSLFSAAMNQQLATYLGAVQPEMTKVQSLANAKKPNIDSLLAAAIKAGKAFVVHSNDFLKLVQTWDEKEGVIKTEAGIDFKTQQLADNIHAVEKVLPLSNAQVRNALNLTRSPIMAGGKGAATTAKFVFCLYDSSAVNITTKK